MTHTLSRAAIVAEARAWIGTRYCHQASVKGVGCDCLGLVRGVWRACVATTQRCASASTKRERNNFDDLP